MNPLSTLRLLVALAVAALPIASSIAAGPRDGEPLTLIVAYHTAPSQRAAFRDELETNGVRQWQKWQDDHAIAGYRLLFNRHVDSGSWDALAIVRFAGAADAERWKDIERKTPAGLTPKALAITTAIETVPADRIRDRSGAEPSPNAVFLVIPYETLVPVDEYVTYLDDYVLPQTTGWMTEGVLSSYAVYLPRYPAGRSWHSMLLLEYRDEASLGRRDAVVAKVRAALKENPKWRAVSDSKKNVRSEKQLAIADSIVPR